MHVRPNLLFFQGEQEHLVCSTYLYTQNLICTLQCFLCFVLPMSRNYSSSVCLCSKQQITIALILSSGKPNVCFLFRRAASLLHCPNLLIVFASVCPCYLWKTKLPENREVAWRYTLPAAKRCNHCQEFDRKPSVTSATPPPLHTILPALPTRLTLLFEDGAMT